jgi:hypothetical protein
VQDSNQKHKPSPWDFDEWAELASADPDAFEVRRARIIETHISRAPLDRQQRLRCLQWRIDQVRRQAGTPLAACIRISNMMWDSVMGPGGLHEVLNRASVPDTPFSVDRRRTAPVGTRSSAKVLAFPDRRVNH